MKWSKELSEAREACEKAKKILMGHFGSLKSVRTKLDAGLVSEADENSELAIRDYLKSKFPQYGFLGEEGGEESGAHFEGRWIVDPLDGTTNYVYGYPFFCISIGLEVKGKLVLGLVEAPILGQCFWATEGSGAFLNGNPIHVSKRQELKDVFLATGFYHLDDQNLDEQMKLFRRMITKTAGVRRAGSAALDLCHVACGIFDGFWEKNLKPWDVAAGTVIVREAGGVVTDYRGKNYDVRDVSLLATSEAVNSMLLTEFRGILLTP